MARAAASAAVAASASTHSAASRKQLCAASAASSGVNRLRESGAQVLQSAMCAPVAFLRTARRLAVRGHRKYSRALDFGAEESFHDDQVLGEGRGLAFRAEEREQGLADHLHVALQPSQAVEGRLARA